MPKGIARIPRTRTALADEVYEALVAALLDGRLKPGDRLVQDRLAEELDVSRTPVRDALLRLKEERVIEPAGRRGFEVRGLTAADVRALYDARYAIEGHAAAVVAEAGPEALAPARKALERGSRADHERTRDSFEANRAFHRAVVEGTGNPLLLDFFDAIWGQALGGLAYHNFFVATPYDRFMEDHEQLLEQIASGDPDAARRAMIEHIRAGFNRTPASHDG